MKRVLWRAECGLWYKVRAVWRSWWQIGFVDENRWPRWRRGSAATANEHCNYVMAARNIGPSDAAVWRAPIVRESFYRFSSPLRTTAPLVHTYTHTLSSSAYVRWKEVSRDWWWVNREFIIIAHNINNGSAVLFHSPFHQCVKPPQSFSTGRIVGRGGRKHNNNIVRNFTVQPITHTHYCPDTARALYRSYDQSSLLSTTPPPTTHTYIPNHIDRLFKNKLVWFLYQWNFLSFQT